MIPSIIQHNELDSFKMGNSILKNAGSTFGKSFEEVLETKAKETAKKSEEKAGELVTQVASTKKKKDNNDLKNELPNISQILNNQGRPNREIQNTYDLLGQLKHKKSSEEEGSKGLRQQTLNNAHNFAGQPLLQPLNDQSSQRRRTKTNMLEAWEKFTPVITEDITKRSIRLDIPLSNDVQAVVLRMHPDKSITASLLGSKEMGELIKQNKDKLDKNLRHHHLSLKEFNTYQGDLLFNSDSGTKRGKKKAKLNKKQTVDLM